MAFVPSGPWSVRAPGAGQGRPPRPPGAPTISEEWRTGTWLDEYAAVYKALSVPTQMRGPIAPSEVDRLEIPVVAALLGIPADPLRSTDVHVLSSNLNAARMAAAEAAQQAARAEGREISLAEAELEAGTSWQHLVQ